MSQSLPTDVDPAAPPGAQHRPPRAWTLLLRQRSAQIGISIIAVFALGALLHPLLLATIWDPAVYDPVVGHDAPREAMTVVETVVDAAREIDVTRARLRHDPTAQAGDVIDVARQPAPPSAAHLLGTDPRGRDVLSQLLFGARTAFVLALVAAVTTMVLSTFVAAVAAYRGGWLAAVLMRAADYFLLLPAIPLIIFASALYDVSTIALGVVFGLSAGLGPSAIVLRAHADTVVAQPFIEAARISGGAPRQIIVRHVVPHLLPVATLSMLFTVAAAISAEAILSLFGLLNTEMSWGIMLSVAETSGYLGAGFTYWWLLLPAGLAVTLLAGAFYLVGRACDALVAPQLARAQVAT